MKVILKESIEKLGNEGDVVNVKPGYGRNFLIPQSKAVLATPGALRTLENEREAIERRVAATIQDAEKLKEMIEKTQLTIEVNVGDEDKLFGSVTNRQIAELLTEKGFDIDRKNITFEDEIKTTGEFKAVIALVGELKAYLPLTVVAAEE
tara:strand:+ start:6819 stop:7268 length:450 start_codon:yes stop_codon:yes gene_type:complete